MKSSLCRVWLIAGGVLFAGSAESHAQSGRVVSALDGAPLAGLTVSRGDRAVVTDAEGRFRLDPPGEPLSTQVPLQVDGFRSGYCSFRRSGLAHDDRLEIALLPGETLDTDGYDSFLSFFASLTGTGRPRELLAEDVTLIGRRMFHGTRLLRWAELPLSLSWDSAAPGSEAERAVVEEAIDEWEMMTGLDLFRSRPVAEALVLVGFRPEGSWTRFSSPAAGQESTAVWLNVAPGGDAAEVRSRAEHELGHALFLLGHSRDPSHVMYGGGTTGQAVSRDEARVVRAMMGLPAGIDLDDYFWPPTEDRRGEEGSDWALVVAAALLMFMIVIGMEASR